MNFFKRLFKSSETTTLEESLKKFDGVLTNETIARHAVEAMVRHFEEKDISPAKIKKIIKEKMPEIIKMVRHNKAILERADLISGDVVSRDKIGKEIAETTKDVVVSDEEMSDKELKTKVKELIKAVESGKVEKQAEVK